MTAFGLGPDYNVNVINEQFKNKSNADVANF